MAVRSVTICMCRWVEYLALEADFHPPRFDLYLSNIPSPRANFTWSLFSARDSTNAT